ncbi:MAG: nitronate monooxygenase [Solirubrobacterales bacterium]|nr:nitronate monooxygenase [Solirubrobacterales bacterium]
MTFPAVPIVAAPMGGGPSTPELVAAVSGAGGLGFLAAGYRTAEAVAEDVRATRELTAAPIGVNVFVPGAPADPATYAPYVERLRAEGHPVGEPRWEDDAYAAKLDLLASDPVAVVSFTFGCPDAAVVRRLQAAGSTVWVTVTSVDEARAAVAAGADALVAQGVEAGAHRGSFADDAGDLTLLVLLQLLRAATDVPLVASGGIASGAGVAAALAAGARAAQLGTAFLRCPEAGTAPVHRDAVATAAPTRITRAFTGRQARGIVNRFLAEHTDGAPAAYPEGHHATAPVRAAARAAGDADALHLWAGQAHELAREVPAGELVRALAAEARDALAAAGSALR